MSTVVTNKGPRVECGYFTDPGRDPDKQVNEDSGRHGPTSRGYLAVVCDGMGGHEGGQEASRAAVETIFECVENAPNDLDHRQALERAVENANQNVYALAKPSVRARPGSTVVAVLIHPGGAEIVHVGDSRVYLFHAGEIQRLTLDHSAVQMMVDAGAITPEQAKVHPDANVITRALGMAPDVEVESRPEPFPYVPGDVFLLCSDGLCDLVSEPDMPPALMMAPTLAAAAAELTELANSRGGHDNITVLLVRTQESSDAARDVRPTLLESPQGATVVTDAASAAAARGKADHDTLVTEPLRPPTPQGKPKAAGPPPVPQTLLMGPLAGGGVAAPAGPAVPPGSAAGVPGAAGGMPQRVAIPANPHKQPPRAGARAERPSWLLPLVLAVGLLAVVIGAGLLFLVIREERANLHKTPAVSPSTGDSVSDGTALPKASGDPLVPQTAPSPTSSGTEAPMVHPRDLLLNHPVSPAPSIPSSMPRR